MVEIACRLIDVRLRMNHLMMKFAAEFNCVVIDVFYALCVFNLILFI